MEEVTDISIQMDGEFENHGEKPRQKDRNK